MEPQEVLDTTQESAERHDRLSSRVAVTIAILAVCMGVFKIKDDNICQAMQQAQADRIDNWGWYQAHKTRMEVADATLGMLNAMPDSTSKVALIASWTETAKGQKGKGEEVKALAEKAEKDYDALNYRDDQFDMSDSMLSVAIALLAVTALTRKQALFWFACIPMVIGLVFGLAAMFGLPIHPDGLAKFLGT